MTYGLRCKIYSMCDVNFFFFPSPPLLHPWFSWFIDGWFPSCNKGEQSGFPNILGWIVELWQFNCIYTAITRGLGKGSQPTAGGLHPGQLPVFCSIAPSGLLLMLQQHHLQYPGTGVFICVCAHYLFSQPSKFTAVSRRRTPLSLLSLSIYCTYSSNTALKVDVHSLSLSLLWISSCFTLLWVISNIVNNSLL